MLLCLTIIYGCQPDASSLKHKHFESDHHEAELKWGFVNDSGNEIIEAVYDNARDFSEGLAAVNHQAYWGYVNKEGKIQIGYNYKKATAFENGMAIVEDAESNWQVIDKSGTILLSTDESVIMKMHGEVALVKSKSGLGLIEISGDTLLDFVHSKIYFVEGSNMAYVQQNGTWEIVDGDNNVIELNVEAIYPSRTDRFRFKRSGKYGFLDPFGEVVIDPKYDEAFNFYKGHTMVSIGSSGSVINKSGESISIFSLDSMSYHSPGYLVKSDEDGLRLYDYKLNIIVGDPYDMIYRPSDGIVGLMKDDMWGFYSIDGKCETGLLYPLVWEAKNGLARFIKMREGIGFIDQDCQEKIKAQFYEVHDFHEGLARYQEFY